MRSIPLARQLLALQLVVVCVAVAMVGAAAVWVDQRHTTAQQRERVVSVAESLAASGQVADAIGRPRPTSVLQPLAERVRRRAGVAFVVFMTPDGTRWSHPNPKLIGGRFVGRIAPAQTGSAFSESTTGTLGPSVRAVVPIRAGPGEPPIGLVAVGVLQEAISAQVRRALPGLLAALAAALAVGGALSVLVAGRVRRQTRGLDPHQLAALYEHHDAVLHAIGEGVVVSRDGHLLLVNGEARRLLGVGDEAIGRRVEEVVADVALADALSQGTGSGLHVVGDRVLVTGHRAAVRDGTAVGTVSTLRDRTELTGLVQELATVRGMADALRAQAHEAANEMHTVVGLVELGRHEDAVAFATRRIGITQAEVDAVQLRIGDPALAALLLAKGSSCRERGVQLEIDAESDLPAGVVPDEALVTILGNLIDNALDALAEQRGGRILVRARRRGDEVELRVGDDGPGIAAGALREVFEPGWTTKQQAVAGARRGLGLALVRSAAERLSGTVSVENDGGAVFVVRLPVAAVPA